VKIFKTILNLTKTATTKIAKTFSKPTLPLALGLTFGIIPQVCAAPNGDFGIVTNNGSRVDVYGDYLPTYKGPMHLWKAIYSSNIFTLGPNEGTGNEIR
jgi:hypothetical protein